MSRVYQSAALILRRPFNGSQEPEGYDVYMLKRGSTFHLPRDTIGPSDRFADRKENNYNRKGAVATALRVAFEQAGVLYARDAKGALASESHAGRRREISNFWEFIKQENLTPLFDDFVPVAQGSGKAVLALFGYAVALPKGVLPRPASDVDEGKWLPMSLATGECDTETQNVLREAGTKLKLYGQLFQETVKSS